MQDHEIIDLYWNRSHSAIDQTAQKYANYCYSISNRILHNHEDAEECANDTYLKLWELLPPNRPACFTSFIGKIVRNLALNRWKSYNTQKRGFGQITFALSELDECISTGDTVDKSIDESLLTESINRFLNMQSAESRIIFVKRYWYLYGIDEISKQCNCSQSKIKSNLFRTRNKLKIHLEKERFFI